MNINRINYFGSGTNTFGYSSIIQKEAYKKVNYNDAKGLITTSSHHSCFISWQPPYH